MPTQTKRIIKDLMAAEKLYERLLEIRKMAQQGYETALLKNERTTLYVRMVQR